MAGGYAARSRLDRYLEVRGAGARDAVAAALPTLHRDSRGRGDLVAVAPAAAGLPVGLLMLLVPGQFASPSTTRFSSTSPRPPRSNRRDRDESPIASQIASTRIHPPGQVSTAIRPPRKQIAHQIDEGRAQPGPWPIDHQLHTYGGPNVRREYPAAHTRSARPHGTRTEALLNERSRRTACRPLEWSGVEEQRAVP